MVPGNVVSIAGAYLLMRRRKKRLTKLTRCWIVNCIGACCPCAKLWHSACSLSWRLPWRLHLPVGIGAGTEEGPGPEPRARQGSSVFVGRRPQRGLWSREHGPLASFPTALDLSIQSSADPLDGQLRREPPARPGCLPSNPR